MKADLISFAFKLFPSVSNLYANLINYICIIIMFSMYHLLEMII